MTRRDRQETFRSFIEEYLGKTVNRRGTLYTVLDAQLKGRTITVKLGETNDQDADASAPDGVGMLLVEYDTV